MFQFINDRNIKMSKLITSPGLLWQGVSTAGPVWMNGCSQHRKLKWRSKQHAAMFSFHDFISVSITLIKVFMLSGEGSKKILNVNMIHNTQLSCHWKSSQARVNSTNKFTFPTAEWNPRISTDVNFSRTGKKQPWQLDNHEFFSQSTGFLKVFLCPGG